MTYQYASVERDGPLTLVTIQRPDSRNALNRAAHEELADIFDVFAADPDQWVAILTGAGDKAFCAGQDLKAQADGADLRPPPRGFGGLSSRFDLDKPVIAAINGIAFGGGFELALACDIRIAADTARFSFPETGLGITPGFGGTQRLARLTQAAYAMELIFTGRRIKGEEALEKGIINLLVPAADLRDETMKIAESIAGKAPIAIRMAKAAIHQGLDLDLETGMEVEAELFAECFESNDQKAAMQAFLKKESFTDFRNK